VFFISVSLFFLRFSISWVTSSLILSIFVFNLFISLFLVCSVSLWCLFRAPMCSFICFCLLVFFIFWCLWISWVPLVCFGLSCLVTSPWNSRWLLAGFLLWECSCGHYWFPWYCLSLFCWSPELGIHFLHFPLNPVLIYFRGENFFIPFQSSHRSTWYCATMFLIGYWWFQSLVFFPLVKFCFVGVLDF
jgi:hypothetical protein